MLAGELATARGDYRHGFDRYQQRVREYVARNQQLAKTNAMGLVPRTQWQIWFRNQNVRALPHLPWKHLVTGGAQKAANAIELVEYRPATEVR